MLSAAEIYEQAFDQGLRPDPLLSVSEWADRHRRLSPRASSEPGPWRTSRTPYLKEIMDCLSAASPVERVVVMKGAQVGISECGNNWIGYIIHHAPGPVLAVLPTVEMAKRNSRQRIEPLIAESQALRERVAPARSRDSGNTVLAKDFRGGVLVMTGANSGVGLRSMPVRYLFLDEVDGYPGDVDGEGDPVALALARTRTFARRKVFIVSTPTIAGLSRIEREFEASDQRRYFVPCPVCGDMQWLRFERLQWEKGRPDTAHYLCQSCDGRIEEHHKARFLSQGEWRPTAPGVPGTAGFHLSSLYSPPGWRSWSDIAAAWEAAQGSDAAIKAFKNTELGETWQDRGEAPDWQRLYERREDWPFGAVPRGGLFLTAGADVQKDRIEVSVWAWGRGLESWLIDHVIIDGGPERAEPWAELSALLNRTWPHADGAQLGLAKLGIDTGYEAPAVYAWARSTGFAQVAPLKGVEGFNRAAPIVGPSYVDVTEGGRKLRRGARLWIVAVATFKSETYRFLRLARPTDDEVAEGAQVPAGYVHLPNGMEAEWVKQLVAEQLVTIKTKRGFQRLEWQKLRERNEVLDCRVYARAAAWISGMDRWSEATWRDLEAQVGVEPHEIGLADPEVGEAAIAGRLRTPSQPRARRVFRSSYMS